MAENHGDEYTSYMCSASHTLSKVGWARWYSSTLMGALGRCGMIDPGMAASAKRNRRISAVRMLVS